MTRKTLQLCMTAIATTVFIQCALCATHAVKADFVTSQQRELLDGNRIESSATGTHIRDADGRTHVDINGLIGIIDPIAGVSWQINKSGGVAARRSIAHDPRQDPDGRLTVSQFGHPPPQSVPLPTSASPRGGAALQTDMGMATINSVTCNGKLWSHVIPAGQFGNTMPIETTVEVRTSEVEDIRLPIRVETNDGLGGTIVQELRNVKMIMSDDDMFAPGDAYRIIEVADEGHPIRLR